MAENMYNGFHNMNTTTFDTGERTGGRTRQGLPLIPDTIQFLQYFLSLNPNKSFHRTELFEAVAKEFNVPATLQEAEGKTIKPLFHSQMDYIICDAVHGDREEHVSGSPRVGEPWMKRVAYATYQHITGNGTVSPKHRKQPKVSRKLVEECRVSVRTLKSLDNTKVGPYPPERILCELGGRMWNDDVIEAAIRMEFPQFV